MIQLSRRHLGFLLAIAAGLPARSDAGISITWDRVGGNFQATVTGSFSSAELSAATSTSPGPGFANSPYFDTTPGFGTQWSSSANLTQYYIPLTSLTLTPGFINMNSYSGNTSTGSIVGFYDNFYGYLVLVLDSSYQAGDSIAATLTSYAYEQTLNQSFLFGDVVKLNGAPLITFVQGVPEPSTYGLALGGVALALGALRRRRRS